MSTGPARRHLLRLLERVADDAIDDAALAQLANTRIGSLAAGLVAEAFASDDVTAPAPAQAFVDERLGEFGTLISAETRAAIARHACALIAERAPE